MILIFQNHHFWVQHMNFPGCSVFAPPKKKNNLNSRMRNVSANDCNSRSWSGYRGMKAKHLRVMGHPINGLISVVNWDYWYPPCMEVEKVQGVFSTAILLIKLGQSVDDFFCARSTWVERCRVAQNIHIMHQFISLSHKLHGARSM